MTICHINFSFETGGAENMLVDVLNEQSKNVDVFLIIVNKLYDREIISRISKKVPIIILNRPPANKWNPIYILMLWFIIHKHKPQIIHCHDYKLIQLLIPFKKKCIYTIHNIGLPTSTIYKYNMLYSISEAVRNDVKKRANLDSLVVYNGINFQSFRKKENYLYHEKEVFKIIQIGRLHLEQKGQDVAIKAIKLLIEKYHMKNIHLDIVGIGTSKSYLEELIIKYKLTNFIELIGHKNRPWIYENLSNYHLLIQPSRFEGFGLTVIEAIAAGLPVIASDVDGLSEILRDLPSAYFFHSEDIADLARKLKKMITEFINNKIKLKSEISYDAVCKKFSISTTAINYLNYYNEITI
jgi:glycosyltransferase involved in cell wall biosynthesis